eukprot:4482377-Amphidinium_carterae.1
MDIAVSNAGHSGSCSLNAIVALRAFLNVAICSFFGHPSVMYNVFLFICVWFYVALDLSLTQQTDKTVNLTEGKVSVAVPECRIDSFQCQMSSDAADEKLECVALD